MKNKVAGAVPRSRDYLTMFAMLAILLGTVVIVGIVYSYADRPDIANDLAVRISAASHQHIVRGPR
jgi:predicted lysophospholipase L1 biosynthesis ABC-type transport system permease subunit